MRHPDATTAAVLGRFDLPLTAADDVAAILDGDDVETDDADGSTDPNGSADLDGDSEAPQEIDIEPSRRSSVPAPLADLGEVFVPIPPGEKGTRRPRTPENLYAADDPVLEAYLEAGHNYGVTCRGDLAVVDADEPEALRELLEALPKTASQVSGSRSSEHHFLQVPGLDEDLPLVDPESDEELGHIKAAEQSYVVGPGSRHPSGNRYGPLEGETIATVDEDELRELIEPFRPGGAERRDAIDWDDVDREPGTAGELSVHDVISRRHYPEGARREHPFHGSDTGANFMVDDGAETWRCWRHDCTGNALHLVGVDEGVISCGEWKHGGLSTDTWREIFAAARKAGYDLPEYDPDEAVDPVAVLPNAPVERARNNVWDWRGETDGTLEIDDVRQRTVDTITDALETGADRLVDVLPTGGKSYGAIAAAAREDTPPVSIFTTRGRKEQYGQLAEWCDEQGLTHKTLPSFFEECPTARGDHGDDWAERVRGWYRRGATGQDIHKYAEETLGRPLPCQCDDHGEAVECPYTSAWRFDPDEHPETGEPYDVLLGHYVHAYNPKVTAGRGAIFDEFTSDAYERVLGSRLKGAVSYYLKTRPDVPFDDYTDLIENRKDPQRRADGIVALEGDLEPDGRSVLEDDGAHAVAPLATFTLLAAAENDLGNGLERAPFPDDSGRVGIHHRATGSDRTDGGVRVLTPPDLSSARAVVALDGTPTPALWNLTLGENLRHCQVLDDAERAEYLNEALGVSIVRTTEWLKPYNSPDHVNVADDAALLEAIADKHGEKPGLITTRTALEEYDGDALELEKDNGRLTGEVLDGPADRVRWYGNVLGSNEFKTKRVGAVIGSNHYGDGFIKKWGAYAGEYVPGGKEAREGGEKGVDLSYGEFGDDILTHMREHETLQATLRFGRDGNGATTYVHTDTLPAWVPIAGEGQVIRPKTDGQRQVLDAVESLGRDYWTTADVTEKVDVGERRVRQILDELADDGHVRKGQASDDGRAVEWGDDGLEELPEHVDLPDLEDSVESCGNSRMKTIYTHISGTSALGEGSSPAAPVGEGVATDGGVSIGGDPPPDDPN